MAIRNTYSKFVFLILFFQLCSLHYILDYAVVFLPFYYRLHISSEIIIFFFLFSIFFWLFENPVCLAHIWRYEYIWIYTKGYFFPSSSSLFWSSCNFTVVIQAKYLPQTELKKSLHRVTQIFQELLNNSFSSNRLQSPCTHHNTSLIHCILLFFLFLLL